MSFFVQLPSLTFLKLTHFYYSLCPAKEFLSLGHSHLTTNGILKESSHFTWLSTSRQNIFARHEDYAQIVATLWTQSKIMIHETQHSKSSNLVAFLGWVEFNNFVKMGTTNRNIRLKCTIIFIEGKERFSNFVMKSEALWKLEELPTCSSNFAKRRGMNSRLIESQTCAQRKR